MEAGIYKTWWKKINLDINEIADEIFKEGVYLTSTLNNSACILLISAFARTRDWDDQNDSICNFTSSNSDSPNVQ